MIIIELQKETMILVSRNIFCNSHLKGRRHQPNNGSLRGK